MADRIHLTQEDEGLRRSRAIVLSFDSREEGAGAEAAVGVL
ncbi:MULTISPECIES: hypothetical protein [unclassified Streptomyces]|nr:MULTISPECIES: hypothetical protein [unclassified Streptomyces]SCF83890.1 hypothetical protein GA0115259_103427 [Streptomyces sp. MnatMP-M17]